MFGKKKADVAADDEYDYTKDQNYDETKKVSEQELIDKYQKHFDKNSAMKLLVKLRKSTRNRSEDVV